jgi:hypothetical protein
MAQVVEYLPSKCEPEFKPQDHRHTHKSVNKWWFPIILCLATCWSALNFMFNWQIIIVYIFISSM